MLSQSHSYKTKEYNSQGYFLMLAIIATILIQISRLDAVWLAKDT